MNSEMLTLQKNALPTFLHPYVENAWQGFQQKGFPTTKLEAWKYDDFSEIQRYDQGSLPKDLTPSLPSFLQDRKNVITVCADHVEHQIQESGIYVWDLVKGLEDPMFEKLLQQVTAYEDRLFDLNSAFLKTGVCIGIAEKKQLSEPIYIYYHTPDLKKRIDMRTLILATSFSSASVVEVFGGEGQYHFNGITQVSLQEHAKLNHIQIQIQSDQALHTTKSIFHQQKGSQLQFESVALGAAKSRVDSDVHFLGTRASAQLLGTYLPENKQLMDHHVRVHHHVGGCHSEQDFKGVLFDQAHGIFYGEVLVDQDAQKTQADQINRNLLLSPKAKVDTTPRLEILADDVKCSHGATVGKLNEDQLFYLRSRGISRQRAQKMLILGFVNFSHIQDATLQSFLKKSVEQKID